MNAEDFIEAIDQELKKTDRTAWLAKTDLFLADKSWDNTVSNMMQLMNRHLNSNFSIAS